MPSCASLCRALASLIVLALAVLVGLIRHVSRPSPGIRLPPPSAQDDGILPSLSPDVQADFQRHGVVVVRKLLTPAQVHALQDAVDEAPSPPSLHDVLLPLRGKEPSYATIRFDVWRTHAVVATWALRILPAWVAPLITDGQDTVKSGGDHASTTTFTTTTTTFRLLRDAYFAYQPGQRGCGWHVDDVGFWPTRNDTGGVTVWIALDDMPVGGGGGGLAIANRTRLTTAQWQTCRKAIQKNTCAMATLSPECHELLDSVQVDSGALQAGDALVWDRWVFHRTQTVPAHHSDDKTGHDDKLPPPPPKRRYSVRYVPGHAVGQGALHASVKEGTRLNGPYYPQVWPAPLDSEQEALARGLASDMSVGNLVVVLGRRAVATLRDRVVFFFFGRTAPASRAADNRV